MKTYHVFSTLANDQRYRNYAKGSADLPLRAGEVLINGGAGVANDRIITPEGVKTVINEDEYKLLRDNPTFMLHYDNGFITVSEGGGDADKVADDMNANDPSRPPKPEQFGNDSSTQKNGETVQNQGNKKK